MEKKSNKHTALGRKIVIGKHVMNAIRKSRDGLTVEQLKEILHTRENAVFPTIREINLALKNGLQRGALLKEDKFYKATDIRYARKVSELNDTSDEQKLNKKEKAPTKFTCPICLEEKKMRNGVSLLCNHIFCMPCIGGWSRTCPVCRRSIMFAGILS